MSLTSASSSPAMIDRVLNTVTVAYSQSLEPARQCGQFSPLLRWCLDEIQDTYDPDNPDPATAYVGAISAMENAMRDLQAIVDALEDQLKAES